MEEVPIIKIAGTGIITFAISAFYSHLYHCFQDHQCQEANHLGTKILFAFSVVGCVIVGIISVKYPYGWISLIPIIWGLLHGRKIFFHNQEKEAGV